MLPLQKEKLKACGFEDGSHAASTSLRGECLEEHWDGWLRTIYCESETFTGKTLGHPVLLDERSSYSP
jgi:hypothetical protein